MQRAGNMTDADGLLQGAWQQATSSVSSITEPPESAGEFNLVCDSIHGRNSCT